MGGPFEKTDLTEIRNNPSETPSLGAKDQLSTEFIRNAKKPDGHAQEILISDAELLKQ